MSRQRVLIFIKGLGVGGAEKLLVNSIPHLDREAFDYRVAYMLPWKSDLVPAFEEAGIPVDQLGGSRGSFRRTVRDLRELIAHHRIDLVDAHLPVPGVAARLVRRRDASFKLLYHEHSLSVQRRFSRGRYLAFMANVATYRWNDVVVCVSADTEADVRRFVRNTPIEVILNGIPLPEAPPLSARRAAIEDLGVSSGDKVVGHVAKMVSKKRQNDLISAAAKVIAERPQTSFVLIGQGPKREALIKRVSELGLSDSILFPGFVEDLNTAMAGFDVFALSSAHEGLPTVVIEAHSLGVPVVATDVGGTSEIVADGSNGYLVPLGDIDAMSHRLLDVIGDEVSRSRMSKSAIESSRRFDIERCVRETEALYHKTLGQVGADH